MYQEDGIITSKLLNIKGLNLESPWISLSAIAHVAIANMVGLPQNESEQVSGLVHDSHLLPSSQAVAERYRSGAKLWHKQYFIDIKLQLTRRSFLKEITVHCFDESTTLFTNPLFGIERPT